MNCFYTREFELYAEKMLQEYQLTFFQSKDDGISAQQNKVLAFNRNLISFSQKLNEKALHLHAAACLINPDYSNNSPRNIFTLGKEYIRKFTILYKN